MLSSNPAQEPDWEITMTPKQAKAILETIMVDLVIDKETNKK